MMAPSGKFWMAMPRDSARAAIRVICASPASQPAYTTPTAMPSGILCSVTASTSMVVFCRRLWGPSAFALFMCRWGITRSSTSRNSTPSQKPTTAGTKDHLPMSWACSMAGISRLQMEAATITPAAKPVSARCTRGLRDFFMKNTQAAPRAVPANGIRIPCITWDIIFSPFAQNVNI